MRHQDITEVSDPHLLTIDAPVPDVPEIRVLKGEPTDAELAAVVTVLAGLRGGPAHPGPQELNLWGHPVDKLRYEVTSWQRVTLLERTHVRRWRASARAADDGPPPGQPMTRVVLGSASTGRRRVLRQAGIDPLIAVSGVDEDAIIESLGAGADPATVVTTLAEAKADEVRRGLDPSVTADCVVIGCDSMLHIDGRLVGKPGSPEEARQRWTSMAGRTGRLFTGHCVIRVRAGEVVATATAAETTAVRFGVPTEAELSAYIDSGEPLGVAGAFTLDGLGGWFIDGIDGDPSNVVGLGLAATRRLLETVGCGIGDLWRANPPASSVGS